MSTCNLFILERALSRSTLVEDVTSFGLDITMSKILANDFKSQTLIIHFRGNSSSNILGWLYWNICTQTLCANTVINFLKLGLSIFITEGKVIIRVSILLICILFFVAKKARNRWEVSNDFHKGFSFSYILGLLDEACSCSNTSGFIIL